MPYLLKLILLLVTLDTLAACSSHTVWLVNAEGEQITCSFKSVPHWFCRIFWTCDNALNRCVKEQEGAGYKPFGDGYQIPASD